MLPDMVVSLSIGDLARRTTLSPATLRMWESRHGFPVASRLVSGHRRYSEDDVLTVRAVVAHRDAGMRLEQAIAHVRAEHETIADSVFAHLRRQHPELETHRLRKGTLAALSRAFEDEFRVRADRGTVWGAFQVERHYRAVQPRWEEMARVARQVIVLAEFEDPDPDSLVREVGLPCDGPMRKEWVLVCDGDAVSVVLAAWEVPGQGRTAEQDRVYEALWSVDREVVQQAARVCSSVAQENGVSVEPPPVRVDAPDQVTITAMFNRVVSYLDRMR